MDKKLFKICRKCNIEKDVSLYHKDKTKKDGYKNSCKECQKVYNSKFYNANQERINNYSINYYKKISEDPIYKEKRKEYMSIWCTVNSDKRKKYNKEYNRSNRESIKCQKFKNKEHINTIRRNTKRNNPLIRIKCNIRTLIYTSFKGKGYKKGSHTEEIIGCSYSDFKLYIESKFEPWMNWNNYGKCNGEEKYGWDLDHIIPASSANSIEELYLLNRFDNLQPLCSKINRYIKRDKLIYG